MIVRCHGWRWNVVGHAIWRRRATQCRSRWKYQPCWTDIDLPQLLDESRAALGGHDDLLGILNVALVAEPPLLVRDGGFVAPGYDGELDEVAQAARRGPRGVIAGLQAELRSSEAGISTALKIKHNNVLGILHRGHGDPVPRKCSRRTAESSAFHPPPDDRQRGALHDAWPLSELGDEDPERRAGCALEIEKAALLRRLVCRSSGCFRPEAPGQLATRAGRA